MKLCDSLLWARMQAGSSPTSKVGKVRAITMLNNANLGDTTLSSAKIQLINAAQGRDIGVTRKYNLEDQDRDKLKWITTSIEFCLQIFQVPLNALVTSKEQFKSGIALIQN